MAFFAIFKRYQILIAGGEHLYAQAKLQTIPDFLSRQQPSKKQCS
jgi:hypothetical protein